MWLYQFPQDSVSRSLSQMVGEGAVAGESDSPARVRARGRVVRDLGRRVVEPEPEPNTADSALFVQAAAPSSTLVDRLGRLDGQLSPSPTPAAPASPAPATHPVTRSNVTYIVSRSDKDSTRTADVSLNLVLVVGLGLLLVVSAPRFQVPSRRAVLLRPCLFAIFIVHGLRHASRRPGSTSPTPSSSCMSSAPARTCTSRWRVTSGANTTRPSAI